MAVNDPTARQAEPAGRVEQVFEWLVAIGALGLMLAVFGYIGWLAFRAFG